MNRLVLVSLCAVGALGWGGASASAQECESDDECPEGMACEPGGFATSDCMPGEVCDAPERLPGECQPQKIECETDADCPAGLTCVDRSGPDVGVCTAPAPGVDAGVVCETVEFELRTRTCTSDESDGSNPGSSSDDRGCSVAPAGRGTALVPLVLLTAAAFLARRRRRG